MTNLNTKIAEPMTHDNNGFLSNATKLYLTGEDQPDSREDVSGCNYRYQTIT
jgi:hypothetical protein